jgi:hypothetical protein
MKEPRRSFALCNLDGMLYAIGGNNGNCDLRSVEEYDPVRNSWSVSVYCAIIIRFHILCATFFKVCVSMQGRQALILLTSVIWIRNAYCIALCYVFKRENTVAPDDH